MRYAILGMGAAGIAAAEAIRAHDSGGEIVCISFESDGYYSRPGLAYYLSKEMGKRSLYPMSDRDFSDRQIKKYHNLAVRLDTVNNEILLSDGKRLRYDKALLALGAEAVVPDLEGVNLKGVVYLDSMARTREMIDLARRHKRAVVVGGGITALELAEGLAARRVRVDYFLRGDRYWNRVLDEMESGLIIQRLKHEGVQVHFNTEVGEIVGKRGQVNAVRTTDGRLFKTNLVGLAIGVRPRLDLARVSGLTVNRGVIVDEFLQTSAPQVWAAGDVAEVVDPDSGRGVVDSLWPVARQQGRVAGLNMAGIRTEYHRRSPLNVTRLAGLTTTIIGQVGTESNNGDDLTIVRGESETWQRTPEAVICQNVEDINRVRVMVAQNKLVGAVVMGDQALSRPLDDLISNEANIAPIRDRLTAPGADISKIIRPFWENWRRNNADQEP
jgi:NAD(P)H-nitrite reductase large subunit